MEEVRGSATATAFLKKTAVEPSESPSPVVSDDNIKVEA
jgi:hypothetical protein